MNKYDNCAMDGLSNLKVCNYAPQFESLRYFEDSNVVILVRTIDKSFGFGISWFFEVTPMTWSKWINTITGEW